MKPKIKKCKNKGCENKFEQFNSLISWCSSKCGYELSQVKLKEKESKEWKQRKNALKDKIKTLSQYEIDAKKSFQKWVRLRDSDLPCISCGNSNAKDWAGGHYFSAGTYSGMMFNERNVHKQCNTYCNMMLSGNLLEYRKGLINRFGNEFVNELESESDAKRSYKYTKHELIAIKLKYDILIKEIN